MKTLVFLLEEPSAQDLIEGLLPRLVAETLDRRFLIFEGKQDLERKLERRLRGWLTRDTQFLILRDQDAQDCVAVRQGLSERAKSAGRPDAIVRIACRELEAWVLGDLAALGEAFGKPNLASHKNKRRYRNPDSVYRPVEEIRKLVPTYQKRDGARRVGPLLDPQRNTSPSFAAFCRGVRRLASAGMP